MTSSHKEFDDFRNEWLVQLELMEKGIIQIQEQTLKQVEKTLSDPNLNHYGLLSESIALKESLIESLKR